MKDDRSMTGGIPVNLRQDGSSGGSSATHIPNPIQNDKPGQVETMDDVALTHITIDQFPVVDEWRKRLFRRDDDEDKDGTPKICDELPRLLTESMQKTESNGMSDFERRVEALNHVFTNKTALVKTTDLLPGQTTTSFVGPIVYVDTIGYCIWPELETVSKRAKTPYKVDREVIDRLNKEIFPYWLHKRRVVQEYARYNPYDTDKYKDDGRDHVNGGKLDNGTPSIDPPLKKEAGITPKCQELLERVAFFLSDKATCVSHTVPDFNRLLKFGLNGLIEQMQKDLASLESGNDFEKEKKTEFLKGVIKVFEGAKIYAGNLADAAENAGNGELAKICRKVPAQPAETLHEAMTSIWICYHLLLQENTNFGFSIGRMDQLLNPYYIEEWKKLTNKQEKDDYTRKAVELMCHFFLHCCDHVPLSTEGGDALFAGSGSNQALTVGGTNYVNEKPVDAVNDMTYIILKATEILSVRDPNVHVRFHKGVHNGHKDEKEPENVEYSSYLKRIAQVNLVTKATPAIHGDVPVTESMANYYEKFDGVEREEAEADAYDYCSIGCIEENSAGRHYGNTGSTLFVIPTALELTLFGGKHRMTGVGKKDPYMFEGGGLPDEKYKTKRLEEMGKMAEFIEAFETQLDNLAFFAVQSNNYLGRAMEKIRQVPFLSGLFIGPTNTPESNGGTFTDLSSGGAKYNSSGVAVIGLADVIDSFCVIDYLVFRKPPVVSAEELISAINSNFSPNGSSEKTSIFQRISDLIWGRNNGSSGVLKLSPERLTKIKDALKTAPFYGAGVKKEGEHDNSLAVTYTNKLTEMIQRVFYKYRSYRGGRYLVGYWSMTNHAGFGSLARATPNGREDYTSFASGITPCSGNLDRKGKVINVFDHIKSVTSVKGDTVQNGYTYNLSLTPGSKNEFEKDTSRFAGYIKSFIDEDGVLVQLCVDSIEEFKKADDIVTEIEDKNKEGKDVSLQEKQLEKYKDLMIRVAGYSAYFVDMNKTMRDEVISRANFSLETELEKHEKPYSVQSK